MIACSATWSWMLHDSAGKLLDLGRRRRRPNAALRRAARERDSCRCRFPGCESRRVDLHHIQYWSNGGRTKLDNLVSLCRYHHQLVHDRGYLIAVARDGTFTFYQPGGTPLPACPPLPQADGTIEELPRRGHNPRDDHPLLVRRAAGPGPRHLHLLRQRRQRRRRQAPARTRTARRPPPRPSPTAPVRPSSTSRSGPSSGSSSRRTGCLACAVAMRPTETDIRDRPDQAGAATRRHGRHSTRVASTGLMRPHAAPRPGSAGQCALRSVP